MKSNGQGERFVSELVALAMKLCPQAQVTVSSSDFEDFVAEVDIVVPDDTPDDVYEALDQKNYELDMEHGCNILLNIVERSRHVPTS